MIVSYQHMIADDLIWLCITLKILYPQTTPPKKTDYYLTSHLFCSQSREVDGILLKYMDINNITSYRANHIFHRYIHTYYMHIFIWKIYVYWIKCWSVAFWIYFVSSRAAAQEMPQKISFSPCHAFFIRDLTKCDWEWKKKRRTTEACKAFYIITAVFMWWFILLQKYTFVSNWYSWKSIKLF